MIELTNKIQTNQATLHTSFGCKMETSCDDKFAGTWSDLCSCSGTFNQLPPSKCTKTTPDNFQCGIYQTEAARGSSAEALNRGQGGMYAMERTLAHLKIWFWPRGNEPADLRSSVGRQDGSLPELAMSEWGMPFAEFPLEGLCPSAAVGWLPPKRNVAPTRARTASTQPTVCSYSQHAANSHDHARTDSSCPPRQFTSHSRLLFAVFEGGT